MRRLLTMFQPLGDDRVTKLSKTLQAKREALGFSLQQLGHMVGCTPTYLERIESGDIIPKPEVARHLARVLQEPEEDWIEWSKLRCSQEPEHDSPKPQPRYPEARAALIDLCEDPTTASMLFRGASIGPLEAALYGLLINQISLRMGDLGFWGFRSPNDEEPLAGAGDGRLLLEAFFEMLVHPEGEHTDYRNVFSEFLSSWRYGPGPHRITVTTPDREEKTFRLALVDREGSIIPALEPEDPFYAMYRMLEPSQRKDLAELSRILLRQDSRLEIQAALEALARWHKL